MWSLLSSEKLCDNVDNVTINPVCNCHFRLYYNIFKRSYGELSGDTMLTSLQASLDAYNKKEGAECGKMFADSKNIIIALCSPLMRRVHSMIPESAEMVFVDSSGNCDRTNSRVFLLLTHSAIGGLPLGVMITSSESQSVITAGLQLLKSILPEDAFFRRGDLGPTSGNDWWLPGITTGSQRVLSTYTPHPLRFPHFAGDVEVAVGCPQCCTKVWPSNPATALQGYGVCKESRRTWGLIPSGIRGLHGKASPTILQISDIYFQQTWGVGNLSPHSSPHTRERHQQLCGECNEGSEGPGPL